MDTCVGMFNGFGFTGPYSLIRIHNRIYSYTASITKMKKKKKAGKAKDAKVVDFGLTSSLNLVSVPCSLD